MPRVKPLSQVVDKFTRNGAAASRSYAEGVANPRRDWAQATAAASDSYAQGVQEAIADGRFARGVENAGTAKQRDAALNKGAQRFGPGIAASGPAYQAGIQPYLQVIESTSLPPRQPKGSPQNIERVRILAEALHNRKIQGG